MANINRSISLKPNLYSVLEEYADTFFQGNISMCVGFIAINFFKDKNIPIPPIEEFEKSETEKEESKPQNKPEDKEKKKINNVKEEIACSNIEQETQDEENEDKDHIGLSFNIKQQGNPRNVTKAINDNDIKTEEVEETEKNNKTSKKPIKDNELGFLD